MPSPTFVPLLPEQGGREDQVSGEDWEQGEENRMGFSNTIWGGLKLLNIEKVKDRITDINYWEGISRQSEKKVASSLLFFFFLDGLVNGHALYSLNVVTSPR